MSTIKTLVICWGSTQPIVQEALTEIGSEEVAMLHFGQIWPIHPKVDDYVKKAKKLICLEGNGNVPRF